MPTKYFGQFLLEQSVITRGQLLKAMQYQKQITRPLLGLSVEHAYLTSDQLKLIDAKRATSDATFIEIAVQSGMLTVAQIEELSQLQSERWVFLGQALIETGAMSLVDLDRQMEEYRLETHSNTPTGMTLVTDLPNGELIGSFVKLTVEMFMKYTSRVVEVTSVEQTAPQPEGVAYVFSQQVTGDYVFCYALALPEILVLAIASHMIDEEIDEIDALALDAVSEFVNIVVGNGCVALSTGKSRASAQPPQALPAASLEKLLPADAVAVKLTTRGMGVFQVLLFFAENNGSDASTMEQDSRCLDEKAGVK